MISIEITNLDENSLQGRRTNDSGYIAFINNLNKDMGKLIPNGLRMLISFYHSPLTTPPIVPMQETLQLSCRRPLRLLYWLELASMLATDY